MEGTETSADSIGDELNSAFGTETSAEAPVQAADATAQGVPVSGEAEATLEAPRHWTEGDRSLFGNAPREIQQRWLSRETEYTKGFDTKAQEVANFRREREQQDQIFAPFDRDLELRGLSRQQFMGSLIGAHKLLLENPAEGLKWVAQQYGVDPAALLEQKQSDPQFDRLSQGFQKLNQRLDGFVSASQKAEHEANVGKVQAFAEAKDEKGQPLRPYFDDVAEDVLALMKSGVKDLDQAYTKAVRMNDQIWEKEQQRKAAATQVAAKAKQQAEIDKAKRAGTTASAREAGNGSARPSTLKEELETAFAGYST